MKLLPPPCAVLLVYLYPMGILNQRSHHLLLAHHGEWGLAPHSVLAICAARELPVQVPEVVAQPVAMTSALMVIALQVLEAWKTYDF